MFDTIVIGAGPAGLTAALYLKRAGKNILVLEANTYGGSIINTLEIDNYPTTPHISGYDFATNLYNQVKELDTLIKFEKVIGFENKKKQKEVLTEKNKYLTKTIIIATGSINRKLELLNEEKYIGHGVSYCATCDGTFYKNKDVVVVGGGNTAVEDAIYLSTICNKVYLIHQKNYLRADDILIKKLETINNIIPIYNTIIKSIDGSEFVESITLEDKDKNKKNIKVSGLFIAIGRIPQNDIFNLVKCDEFGYIIAKENCHTNIKGVYAAGDNRTKNLRQLVTATSDGAIAANEAIKYLNEHN